MQPSFLVETVLGKSIQIWGRNLPAYLLVTALLYLPLWVWIAAVFHGGGDLALVEEVDGLASLLPSTLLTAALAHSVVGSMQGQRVLIRESITTGLARPWPMLGAAIIAATLISIGLFVLVVPGLVLACVLFVVVPSAVMERPGMMASLDRSQKLTKGHRIKLACSVLLLAVALATVIQLCSWTGLSTNLYVVLGLQALASSFLAVMTNVMYGLLREEELRPARVLPVPAQRPTQSAALEAVSG